MATKTALAKTSASAIVDIKAKLAAQVATLGERTAPVSGNAIQISNSKEFRFPDGSKGTSFEAVIIDFIATRNLYPEIYNPKAIKPPICFAIGTNPRNLVPNKASPELQAPACGSCPNAEYETALNGKSGQACKEGRKLAVLPPDMKPDAPIWTINVSPTALKSFDPYVMSVAGAFQMPPLGVVTKFSFNDAFDYPTLVFSEPTPNEHVGEALRRQAESAKIIATEPDVSGYAAAYPNRGKGATKKVAGKR